MHHCMQHLPSRYSGLMLLREVIRLEQDHCLWLHLLMFLQHSMLKPDISVGADEYLFRQIFIPPTVDLGAANVSILSGQTLVLDPGPGFASYSWSTGETTQTIVVGTTDTFTVVVTDLHGCTATDSTMLTVINAVDNPDAVVAWLVYPNPAKDKINVLFETVRSESCIISLTDIQVEWWNHEALNLPVDKTGSSQADECQQRILFVTHWSGNIFKDCQSIGWIISRNNEIIPENILQGFFLPILFRMYFYGICLELHHRKTPFYKSVFQINQSTMKSRTSQSPAVFLCHYSVVHYLDTRLSTKKKSSKSVLPGKSIVSGWKTVGFILNKRVE